MDNKKEHGPHPFALLRGWRLALNPVIMEKAKTELEAEKLINLLTDILLHAPTLNAATIQFTVAQSQLFELQGCSRKTLFNQLKKLGTFIPLTWEQPRPEADGKHKPAVFTVSKNTEGKKTEGNIPGVTEGKKLGVTEGNIPKNVTRSGQKALDTSGHSSGQEVDKASSLRSDEQEQDQGQPQEQHPGPLQIEEDELYPLPPAQSPAPQAWDDSAARQIDEDAIVCSECGVVEVDIPGSRCRLCRTDGPNATMPVPAKPDPAAVQARAEAKAQAKAEKDAADRAWRLEKLQQEESEHRIKLASHSWPQGKVRYTDICQNPGCGLTHTEACQDKDLCCGDKSEGANA